jgi:hypothetical protein
MAARPFSCVAACAAVNEASQHLLISRGAYIACAILVEQSEFRRRFFESIWGQTRHIIGQWPFSIEDGTLDRAEGSAVAEGEAEEAGSRVIPINRV